MLDDFKPRSFVGERPAGLFGIPFINKKRLLGALIIFLVLFVLIGNLDRNDAGKRNVTVAQYQEEEQKIKEVTRAQKKKEAAEARKRWIEQELKDIEKQQQPKTSSNPRARAQITPTQNPRAAARKKALEEELEYINSLDEKLDEIADQRRQREIAEKIQSILDTYASLKTAKDLSLDISVE